jgi:ribonucleotide reductase alpha subunit
MFPTRKSASRGNFERLFKKLEDENMENMSLAAWIDAWTREAVARWGDDWPRISEHIQRRMAALAPDERREIERESQMTLTQPPNAMHN